MNPSQPVPTYSVVIPVYNEVDNVGPLVTAIHQAMAPLGQPWELLIVDDCSRDGSLAALQALQATHPELRVLQHTRNCGQSAAVASGFHAARGQWVITLDADLQNPPSEIPVLLAALTPGVDCINGLRQKRQDSRIKLLSSRLANGFRNWVTGDQIRDAGCGFRVIRRTALREIPVFNGMHRFLPTLLRAQGFTVIEVPVAHAARVAGVSKYGIHNRLWRGLKDCLAIRWYRQRAVLATRAQEL